MAKEKYDELMYMNIDELGEDRIAALEKVVAQKRGVTRAYENM